VFNRRTFSSLAIPAYRFYFAGLLAQNFSMNMQLMARALLIYRLTGSPVLLGAVALSNAIPMMLLSLFGGVIADRLQKKYVLLVGQLCSAVVSVGVALSLVTGFLSAENEGSWWVLIVASVFQGLIMGLMMPSRQALVYEIVPGDKLMNAVALNAFGMNSLRLLAPAVTGLLIDSFDFMSVYFTMTGMYLLAAVAAMLLPHTQKIVRSINNPLTDIMAGINYIRHNRTILLILVYSLGAIVLSMPYTTLMPIFTEDILHVGATGMGLLISASGAGAVIGSAILASMSNRRRGLLLILSGGLVGVMLAAFSFSQNWYLSLALLAMVGFGLAGRMTLSVTLLQYYVKDAYRGRVMSVYLMEFGLTSVGTFAAGIIAASVGVQWAIGSLAIALALLSLLTLIFAPRLRRLD